MEDQTRLPAAANPGEKKSSPLSGLGVIATWIIAKGKLLLALIFKVKGLATLLSMLVSLAVYAPVFGWRGAALFLVLILIHEMGHVYVNWRLGIPSSAPMFIPFVGALITLKKYPRSVEQEAWSALGGPILGSIGGLLSLGIWVLTHERLFLWGASVAFALNLFNLIPMSPLDGGRIVAAISRWLWVAGLALLLIGGMLLREPFLALLVLIGLNEMRTRFVNIPWPILRAVAFLMLAQAFYSDNPIPFIVFALVAAGMATRAKQESSEIRQRTAKEEAYFAISPAKRLMFGAIYLALAGTLVALCWYVGTLAKLPS